MRKPRRSPPPSPTLPALRLRLPPRLPWRIAWIVPAHVFASSPSPTTSPLPLSPVQMAPFRPLLRPIFLEAAAIPADAAAMTGRHVLLLQLWDPKTPYPKDPAALHNIASTTTLRHLRLLSSLQERVRKTPQLMDVPLAEVILHHLTLMSSEARIPWVPQSHFHALTAMDGAFSNLGKYVLNFQGRVKLSDLAVWRAALKTWDQASKEHQPVHQQAATAEELSTAINSHTDPAIRAFLVLLWLMAGRKGDVARLRTDSVKLHPGGRLQLFIQEGKGVRARQGKYHVVTHCPEIWREELSTFLQSATKRHLFRPSLGCSGEINQALRVANPNLSCRAVRRGAAQAMAKDKEVSEETIMKITGHKSVKTLHRYLGWDMINEKAHTAAETAARNNLAPAPPAQH